MNINKEQLEKLFIAALRSLMPIKEYGNAGRNIVDFRVTLDTYTAYEEDWSREYDTYLIEYATETPKRKIKTWHKLYL